MRVVFPRACVISDLVDEEGERRVAALLSGGVPPERVRSAIDLRHSRASHQHPASARSASAPHRRAAITKPRTP